MIVNKNIGRISKEPIDYKTLYRSFCNTDVSKCEELEAHSNFAYFCSWCTSNLEVDDLVKSISANMHDMEKYTYLIHLKFSEEVSLHENFIPELKDAIMQTMSKAKEVRLDFSYSPKSQFLFEDAKLQIGIFEFVPLDD